jgi:hypothetical protein
MAEAARQKYTTGREMLEFKHGALKRGRGGKGQTVKSRRQAIAIALNGAGHSRYESEPRKRWNLQRTERRESAGDPPKDPNPTPTQPPIPPDTPPPDEPTGIPQPAPDPVPTPDEPLPIPPDSPPEVPQVSAMGSARTAERQQDCIVQQAQHRNEVRNQVNRRKRISCDHHGQKLGMPGYTWVASRQVKSMNISFDRSRPILESRLHSSDLIN